MLELDVAHQRKEFTLHVRARIGDGVTGLFGRSGSGKSTLLHLIAGLERPSRGTIRLDGETLSDSATRTFLPSHRRNVGLVFQDGRLFPHYTVRGNLEYGRAPGESLEEVVALLELETLLGRRPDQLSGGERQRVALGRALLAAPRLLLLDEPLANLDRMHRAQILPYLRRVRDARRVPILYVSHEIEEILQLTDHLLLLEAGEARGPASYPDLVHEAEALRQLLPAGVLNVIEMEALPEEQERGCARFRHPGSGTEILAPLCGIAPRARTTLLLRAEDIALSLERVPGISIQNQLPATVRRHSVHEGRVVLDADAGMLLRVELSLGAFRELDLAEGVGVHCLFKSNAVRILAAALGSNG